MARSTATLAMPARTQVEDTMIRHTIITLARLARTHMGRRRIPDQRALRDLRVLDDPHMDMMAGVATLVTDLQGNGDLVSDEPDSSSESD